jgi:two-component system, OmpR family, phosphate regulon sensor histidine kinase PhoR
MRRKILIYFLLLSAMITISILTLASFALSGASNRRMEAQLRGEAVRLSAELNSRQDDVGYLMGSKYISLRVTLIAADGSVLFENFASGDGLENHADRPEVIAALRTGEGSSSRYSHTLGEEYTYYALRLNDGNVLRVSESRHTVLGLIADMRGSFRWIALAAAALSVIASLVASRSIVKPINDINPDAADKAEVYGEVAPLLTHITRQREEISRQTQEMENRQRSMLEITDNMREGLILLDARAHVLSMNRSAYSLLDIQGRNETGRHILEVDRSEPLRKALEEARAGSRAVAELACGGRAVELHISPVPYNQSEYGYVLLLVDVTERVEAEKNRREFSANVSHELKTPLTSILGYAEIMKDGIAKPEDTPAFAGRIYGEAQRLIALIDDILRLSRLDEGGPGLLREPVDMLELANEVADHFADAAAARHIMLTAKGVRLRVTGVRQVLYEMLSNLVDNAIKYNLDNGTVAILVEARGKGAALSVRDTGIGIDKIHHERIFERFYRVDKGRSQAQGGTGLGLSIVKHGARIHGAEITLDSAAGKGTGITIVFREAEQIASEPEVAPI